MTVLLESAATGNGPAVEIKSFANRRFDQLKTLFPHGDFDGATVSVEISHNGTDWFIVTGGESLTVDTALNVEFHARFIRGVVTGGTSPSVNLNML